MLRLRLDSMPCAYGSCKGLEYKQAIADYMLVGGKIPVIPRYALGVWFTRWYDFNNVGVKRLVNKYAEKALPLDVYVTDMNWHKKDNWGGEGCGCIA